MALIVDIPGETPDPDPTPTPTPVTATVYAVRVYVGSETPPTDEEIEAAVIRLGSTDLASREFLKARLGELLTGSASFSVTGYSENNSEIIRALERQIGELEVRLGLTPGGLISSVSLFRPGRCGR
jgi:hypothetical protein